MGTIKDRNGKDRSRFGSTYTKIGRNGKDLIEADEIKKRWKEYPEGLYKKDP